MPTCSQLLRNSCQCCEHPALCARQVMRSSTCTACGSMPASTAAATMSTTAPSRSTSRRRRCWSASSGAVADFGFPLRVRADNALEGQVGPPGSPPCQICCASFFFLLVALSAGACRNWQRLPSGRTAEPRPAFQLWVYDNRSPSSDAVTFPGCRASGNACARHRLLPHTSIALCKASRRYAACCAAH